MIKSHWAPGLHLHTFQEKLHKSALLRLLETGKASAPVEIPAHVIYAEMKTFVGMLHNLIWEEFYTNKIFTRSKEE